MDAAERWSAVPGFGGHYEASSLGRVRSLDRTIYVPPTTHRAGHTKRLPGRVLSPYVQKTHTPYLHVKLWHNNRSYSRSVHQLAAAALIGPKPPDMDLVRHINGNSLDNRVENLTYGTYSENLHDAVRHGARSKPLKSHCKRGHEYTPENSYLRAGKSRECRTCMRMRDTQRRPRLVRAA